MRGILISTIAALGLGALGLHATKGISSPPPGASRAVSEGGDATLSPYFWVKSEDPALDQLPLKATSVKAEIAGVIADVVVTQVYKNEGRKALEAVYVFPGSTRAAVYGMKMTLGDRVIQAKIREKEQARKDYEEAKAQGRSASLLEQQRPNVFQMNVANILPGDEIRVELRYTELIVPTEGTYEFVYPTVVGPRYSNTPASQAQPSEKWVANPYTKEGEAPLSTFNIEVKLAAGMPIRRATCGTHRTSIAFRGTSEAELKLEASEQRGGNRDFILQYQLAGGQIQSGLLLSKGEENFFLLQVQPPKLVKPEIIPPREFVFILDVSGSMHGHPLDTAKTVIRNLVGQLRPQDRFNIEVFESGSALWSPSGSLPGTPENIERALAFIGAKGGGGGTEILSALRRALALPRAEGISRTFVMVTDGYISVEPAVLDLIRENLGDANMFAFGIGSSVNRHLIEAMAHAGQGEPFVVTKPDEAPAQAERFRNYIASPVLTQVRVSFKGFGADDVEPLHIPDVLAERPVICFGKWKGEASGTIEVSGLSGAGRFHQSFQVAQAKVVDSPAALRNLWARHRIQRLSDYAGLGRAQENKPAITELGLKYGLLTEHTSFVAIDSQIRNQGGSQAQVTQPLPMPEGVSNYAVGGASPSPSAAPILFRAKSAERKVMPSVRLEAESLADETSKVQAGGKPLGNETAEQALEAQIRLRLKEVSMQELLKGVPAGVRLELSVDARGQVLSARFTAAFPKAGKALEQIRKWRFAGWKVPGITSCSVAIP